MLPRVRAVKDTDTDDVFAKYRERIRIDRNNLDQAMLIQAVLYEEVSEGYVLACSQRDISKASLERLDAELAAHIRIKWTKEGERFSETRVGDEVIRDARHIQGLANHQELVRKAASFAALQGAVEQRGKMLRELSALFVAGYFSQATSSATNRDIRDGKADYVRTMLAKRRRDE